MKVHHESAHGRVYLSCLQSTQRTVLALRVRTASNVREAHRMIPVRGVRLIECVHRPCSELQLRPNTFATVDRVHAPLRSEFVPFERDRRRCVGPSRLLHGRGSDGIARMGL